MKKSINSDIVTRICHINYKHCLTRERILHNLQVYRAAALLWDTIDPDDDDAEQTLRDLDHLMSRSGKRAHALAAKYRQLPEHAELWQALEEELHPYDLLVHLDDDSLNVIGGEPLEGHITGVSVRWAKGDEWERIYTC